MTAAEAAALIKNGDHIAMSGFTPAGVAKATTKELAKLAVAEHEAGREFKVAIFTGASTGQSTIEDCLGICQITIGALSSRSTCEDCYLELAASLMLCHSNLC